MLAPDGRRVRAHPEEEDRDREPARYRRRPLHRRPDPGTEARWRDEVMAIPGRYALQTGELPFAPTIPLPGASTSQPPRPSRPTGALNPVEAAKRPLSP